MTDQFERLTAALADRYAIERELGAGGMATVYLAHDLKHDRRVAVKVLRPELSAILGGKRFLNEIKVTANLQHPNILPLYDSGEADSFLFYVMPYVEGDTLRDKLDRDKQLGVEEALRIAESEPSSKTSALRAPRGPEWTSRESDGRTAGLVPLTRMARCSLGRPRRLADRTAPLGGMLTGSCGRSVRGSVF
jgi:hypothetical protein